MECAWEYSDELADEGLLITRFDEIASTIAKVTLLPLYLVGECLTVIVGVAQPEIDEYEDDIHDLLVRYFLED